MRKIAVLLLCLLLCSGCSDFMQDTGKSEAQRKEASGSILFGNQKEEFTVPVTEATVAATEAATEATGVVVESIPLSVRPDALDIPTEPVYTEPEYIPTESPVSSYKQRINKNQPIYSGPGYGYSYVGAVEASTNYTIVDESYDSYGNLWGKLKSGVGWVDLSDIRYGGSNYYSTNYIVKITDPYCPVYAEPSYSSSYVGIVQEAGSYTIVAESYDGYGKLWGKLKSGIGWVCLSDY